MKSYLLAICIVCSFTNVLSKNFRGGRWKSAKNTHHKDFEVHEKRGCATKNGRQGSKRNEFDLYTNVSYDECQTMCLGLGTNCYGFEYTERVSRCEIWKVEIYTSYEEAKNRKCNVHKKATGTRVEGGRPTPYPVQKPKPTAKPIFNMPTKFGGISFTTSLYKAIDSDIALLKSSFSSSVERSHFMAGIVRLAAHDFMDYDRSSSNPYGSDGCFDPDHDANAGLPEGVWCDDCPLKALYDSKYQVVSKADYWIAAANAAIRQTSANNILDLESTFTWGRVDRDSCPGSGERIPGPEGCSQVEAAFITRMGLEWVDAVALMGAHSLGIGDEDVSGHGGMWVDHGAQDKKFDKQYYKELFHKAWHPRKEGMDNQDWTLDGVAQDNPRMMLNTDICLVYDIESVGNNCCTRQGECATDRVQCPTYSSNNAQREAMDAVLDFIGGTESTNNSEFYVAFTLAWVKATNLGWNNLSPLVES